MRNTTDWSFRFPHFWVFKLWVINSSPNAKNANIKPISRQTINMQTRSRGEYVNGYYANMLKNKSIRLISKPSVVRKHLRITASEFNELKNKINFAILKNLKTKTTTSVITETIHVSSKQCNYLKSKFALTSKFTATPDFLTCFNVETERYFETFNELKNYCKLSYLFLKKKKI